MESGKDTRELDLWMSHLRDRFVEIAHGRVQPDDVEDVVQQAMTIVYQKGLDRSRPEIEGLPPVAWCLQVLRNVIGNHYRRLRTRHRWFDAGADAESLPVEALSSEECLHVIEASIEQIASADPQCGSYLNRTIDGKSARTIAEEDGVEASAFYQRLFRCRAKLRALLLERGVPLP